MPTRPIRLPVRGGRRLPLLLRRAWYGLNQAFRRRIAHLGLTPDQYTVLRTLDEHSPGDLTQSGLADLMSSDPNTVASLLERMARAGWVEKQRDARDRRAHRLSLHPKGRARLAAARTIALALQREVLRGVPAGERRAFLGRLERLAEACHEASRSPGKRRP